MPIASAAARGIGSNSKWCNMSRLVKNRAVALSNLTLAATLAPMLLGAPAKAETPHFLDTVKKLTVLDSTIPANGEFQSLRRNRRAVVDGQDQKGRCSRRQFQQPSRTSRAPARRSSTTTRRRRRRTLFASVPQHLAACPGGVGHDDRHGGTEVRLCDRRQRAIDGRHVRNDRPGCLLVFDANGKFLKTFAGGHIDGPWGNVALVDRGDTATLFVSQIGAGKFPSAKQEGKLASVLRLELAIGKDGPQITKETVIGEGFDERADKDVFLIGPTGLALAGDLRLVRLRRDRQCHHRNSGGADPNHSAGTGTLVTKEGLLKRPLALEKAPNGNLLAINGLDGEVIEIESSNKDSGRIALDQHQQGANPARQRQSLRHRADARWEGILSTSTMTSIRWPSRARDAHCGRQARKIDNHFRAARASFDLF